MNNQTEQKTSFDLSNQLSTSQNHSTIDLSYDINLLHSEILQLLDDLKLIVKDYPKTQPTKRALVVQEASRSLELKYSYSFNKCQKLFQLAIQYYSSCKSISEFKSIFNNFIDNILVLQQNNTHLQKEELDKNYINTSEKICRFVGKQFNVPES
jgi:hypothetical protein